MIETSKLSHLKRAWGRHNTLDTFMLVVACVLFSALAVVSRPPDNGLIVAMLEFQNGYFAQYVHPVHDETILGNWAAEIVTEDGREVCSGGGSAPYELKKEPKLMTPDQWTGDSCVLKEGQVYVANAVWQWTGSEGHPQSVSRSMTFRYYSDPA